MIGESQRASVAFQSLLSFPKMSAPAQVWLLLCLEMSINFLIKGTASQIRSVSLVPGVFTEITVVDLNLLSYILTSSVTSESRG